MTREGTSEISLNAIFGTPSPNTLRLVGTVSNHRVVILVDSGSTHNFLHSTFARQAKVPLNTFKGLLVNIANGELLQSEGYCM